MSSPNSRIVQLYIKWLVFSFFYFTHVSARSWDVDFSRRQKDLNRLRQPASESSQRVSEKYGGKRNEKEDEAVGVAPVSNPYGYTTESSATTKTVFDSVVPDSIKTGVSTVFTSARDVVLLLTDKGFVPESVTLKQGEKYRIHIVNVNEKDKNVSFILDAFGEHHSIYFGKHKIFEVYPKTTGIFSFVSPESETHGKFVVLNEQDNRKPAGQRK